MNFIILAISFTLLGSCFAFTPSGRDHEVADVILEVIETPREFALRGYKLSLEEEKILQEFSDTELSRGFATLLVNEDKDPVRGNRFATGSLIKRSLSANKQLIEDPSELARLIALEKDPRDFKLMMGLGASICSTRGVDLIPIYFNTLFRDGRTTKEEGEYTPRYADDVSKLAYSLITLKLKKLEANYMPLDPQEIGLIPHEEKVDHLANWLISNWPGCESFTLSDQNVPAILASGSRKKIFRKPSSPNEESQNSSEKVPFKFSWQLIAAIILLMGSLLYWGKKRFAQ